MPDAPLPPLPPAGQPRWRTTVDDLRRRLPASPVALVAVALVVGVLVVAVVLLRPGTAPPASIPSSLPTAAPAAPEPSTPPADGAAHEPTELVVDVTGAVGRPGLVHLRPGSRVADAVAAAGGPAADAAVTGLNQARVLADGEQVRVPRVGEPVAPAPAPTSAGGSAPGAPATPADLNQATAAELDALPGVGPATAAAIVTWRQQHGGFRKIDDLLEVPGIGPAKLERLRPHVRV